MKTKLLFLAIAMASLVHAQDGTLDLNFNSGGAGASITPKILDVDPSGKILLGFPGTGNTYNTVAVKNLTKLNSDGSVDNTFSQYDVEDPTQMVTAAKNLGNSNIILAQVQRTRHCSDFFSCSFGTDLQLKRMDTSGNIDPFFSNVSMVIYEYGMGSTIPVEYSYNTVIEHFNDKVVVGGYFFNYAGSGSQKYSNLMRFDEDGSLDYTFNPGGTGPNYAVTQVLKDPSQKLYIAGEFTTYNGNTAGKLARLKKDGTYDNTFNNGGTGFDNTIKTIALQQDGKILVGGIFTTYNGNPVNNIVRLNTDGSVDSSFSSLTFESATSGAVDLTKLAVLSDGKILFAGRFNKYDFIQTGSIGRLNSDGSLDTTFNNGGKGAKVLTGSTVTNATINAVAAQPDGNIIFAGDFNNYNTSSAKKFFSRLKGATPPITLGTSENLNGKTTQIFPNPSTGIFKVKSTENIGEVAIFDASGRLVKQISVKGKETDVNLTNAQKGLYLIKSGTGKNASTQKLILQ